MSSFTFLIAVSTLAFLTFVVNFKMVYFTTKDKSFHLFKGISFKKNYLFYVRVKLEGEGTKIITVKANLVQQALQVLSLENEEPCSCIHFGNTYYGSDKTECALLYNNGPEPVNFVAILDEDAIAQEMVCWL